MTRQSHSKQSSATGLLKAGVLSPGLWLGLGIRSPEPSARESQLERGSWDSSIQKQTSSGSQQNKATLSVKNQITLSGYRLSIINPMYNYSEHTHRNISKDILDLTPLPYLAYRLYFIKLQKRPNGSFSQIREQRRKTQNLGLE